MTKNEYRQLLITTSAAGGFPAALPAPSQNVTPQARYRLPDGRGCVIGVAIPGEVSTVRLEPWGVDELIEERILTRKKLRQWTGCELPTLLALQNYHDRRAATNAAWDHAHFVSALDKLFGTEEKSPESMGMGELS